MKLYFHITKTSNVFHFISNLTDWHYSVRTSYKKFWLEKTGELSGEDKEQLAKAKILFQKYSFSRGYWGEIFLRRPEDDVWKVAEEKFGETDTERFRKLHDYFLPRFEKLWKDEEVLLNDWKKKLHETSEEYLSDEMTKDLNTLFNTTPNFDNDIKAILLMCSPTTRGGGGANVGRGAITMELSRTPIDEYQTVWLNFWHEMIHVYWEKTNYYMNMLNAYLDSLDEKPSLGDIPYKALMMEAVLEAFMPRGVLAEKYFGVPVEKMEVKGKIMSDWRAYSRYALKSLASKYLEERRMLDEDFLKEASRVLVEFCSFVLEFFKCKAIQVIWEVSYNDSNCWVAGR